MRYVNQITPPVLPCAWPVFFTPAPVPISEKKPLRSPPARWPYGGDTPLSLAEIAIVSPLSAASLRFDPRISISPRWRTLAIKLDPIPDDKRRVEREFWPARARLPISSRPPWWARRYCPSSLDTR